MERKVSILVDRLSELWNGKQDKKKQGKNGGNVKVSQPISGQQTVSTGYTDGTAISALPAYAVTQGNENSMAPQQLPNYDSMYRQDTTPLVGAASPGGAEGMMTMEPMAANAVLGGSFGSSW